MLLIEEIKNYEFGVACSSIMSKINLIIIFSAILQLKHADRHDQHRMRSFREHCASVIQFISKFLLGVSTAAGAICRVSTVKKGRGKENSTRMQGNYRHMRYSAA
jgi:hypothetical protein